MNIIHGKERDLGGFKVHRVIPSPFQRSIGPFVFLDHLDRVAVDEKHLIDVRPHPHIGLATATYLFEGRCWHRDSIGSSQIITPGDLNLMIAGKGIVHSERTPEEDRHAALHHHMHGVQIWIGLPVSDEQCEPSFTHWAKAQLPDIQMLPNLTGKLLIGNYGTTKSPVPAWSNALLIDLMCTADLDESLQLKAAEIGLFIAQGGGQINQEEVGPNDMIVSSSSHPMHLKLKKGTRMIVLGGEPFPEPRFVWWNFVASNTATIRNAAKRWRDDEIGHVPGESDFIPLPTDLSLPE